MRRRHLIALRDAPLLCHGLHRQRLPSRPRWALVPGLHIKQPRQHNESACVQRDTHRCSAMACAASASIAATLAWGTADGGATCA